MLLTSLFLLAGILLLALSYALVRNSLTLDPSQLLPKIAGARSQPTTSKAQTFTQGGAGTLGIGSSPALGSEQPPRTDSQGGPSGPGSGSATAPDGTPSVRISTGAGVAKVNAERLQAQLANRTLHHLLTEYLIVLGALGLLAAAGGWLLAGRVLLPIKRMTRTARAVSQMNLSERIAHDGPQDEFKELADTFDEMLARLQGSFERQRAFIANASHELRTPLAIMRTEADVALSARDPDPEELLEAMRAVRAATTRSDRLIGGLLTLARIDREHQPTRAVELSTLAADALREAGPRFEELALTVNAELDPVAVRGEGRLLETLLRNLIENAVRYNHPDGWLSVSTRNRSRARSTCVLCVSNGGDPIPAGRLTRLTQPFQRLSRDQSGEGTGLGLSIVQAIVTAHHGTLELRANESGGLLVLIELPAAHRGRDEQPLATDPEGQPGTVLRAGDEAVERRREARHHARHGFSSPNRFTM
jgi:signal transduction histidine kinase